MPRPTDQESAPYYFTYINQVPEGDIRHTLAAQLDSTIALATTISEARSTHRYAADKWSIKQVLNHITDTERIFAHRALWFARGFAEYPLPGYDQDIAIAHSDADALPWSSHIEDLRAVRQSTITFYANLPEAAWTRKGTASGNPFTVNALAHIIAGHLEHHLKIVRERYL